MPNVTYVENSVARGLWVALAPVLLTCGTVGNIISFVVMCRRPLKSKVSSLYLRALAVADTGSLLVGLTTVWIFYLTQYELTSYHTVLCKMRNFLFYTCNDCSIWLICGFTGDRFIAVCFPLRKQQLCTRSKAIFAITFIWLLGVMKNTHVLWTRGIVDSGTDSSANITEISADKKTNYSPRCGNPDADHLHFNRYIRPWIVFAFVNLIPFLFVTFCNVAIVRAIRRMQYHRRGLLHASYRARLDSQVSRMTTMCLSVSCAFIVLISPGMILLVGRAYWSSDPASKARVTLARAVVNILGYTNNSINFFLYCVSGQNFRSELLALCGRSEPKKDSSYEIVEL